MNFKWQLLPSTALFSEKFHFQLHMTDIRINLDEIFVKQVNVRYWISCIMNAGQSKILKKVKVKDVKVWKSLSERPWKGSKYDTTWSFQRKVDLYAHLPARYWTLNQKSIVVQTYFVQKPSFGSVYRKEKIGLCRFFYENFLLRYKNGLSFLDTNAEWRIFSLMEKVRLTKKSLTKNES